MVNPFNALYQSKDDAQLQKNQANSLPGGQVQNPQKNTYKFFLRSNIQKILLLMVVIYLGVHIYNSIYCKESFVTFQGENGKGNQKNLGLKYQQEPSSTQHTNNIQTQQKSAISTKDTFNVDSQLPLPPNVEKKDLTSLVFSDSLNTDKKQKVPKNNVKDDSKKDLLLTKESDSQASQQSQTFNFMNYKSDYEKFVNSLKEDSNQARRKNKQKEINQIYSNLNDNHRLNIHAQKPQELQLIVNQTISLNKQYELSLRLVLQNSQLHTAMTDLDNHYHAYLQQKYSFDNDKESLMCIILTTHNNAYNKQIVRSLNSIFNQQYTRYQVVIADRASTDSTYNIIQHYLQTFKLLSKTTLIQTNQESQVYALQTAAQSCKPDTFAVYLDANTQLIGKQALNTLNSQFLQNKPHIVYGSYYELDVSKQKIRIHNSQMYDQSQVFMLLYRNLGNRAGRMISFKTNSVVNIPQKYIKFNEKYFSYSGIESLLIPLLQISCGKIRALDIPLSLSLTDSVIQKKQQGERKHELRQISSFLKLDVC